MAVLDKFSKRITLRLILKKKYKHLKNAEILKTKESFIHNQFLIVFI